MPIVKSFAVCSKRGQPGDMFYINHDNDNFTVIDCCMNDERTNEIVGEINKIKAKKEIIRLISTHPDDDHICGLKDFADNIGIENFYCVKNEATNPDNGEDFQCYCKLRDSTYYKNYSAYHIYKGCQRKWMNISDDERGCSGINVLWPNTGNDEFQKIIEDVKEWVNVNNLSPIITYTHQEGYSFIWFGDMETWFMEKIKDQVKLLQTKIVFAPHHGRESGELIPEWLKQLDPKLVIIGEADCDNLCYYSNYDTITQNTAGDIVFCCEDKEINLYVSKSGYDPKFKNIYNNLSKKKYRPGIGYYIGTIICDNS